MLNKPYWVHLPADGLLALLDNVEYSIWTAKIESRPVQRNLKPALRPGPKCLELQSLIHTIMEYCNLEAAHPIQDFSIQGRIVPRYVHHQIAHPGPCVLVRHKIPCRPTCTLWTLCGQCNRCSRAGPGSAGRLFACILRERLWKIHRCRRFSRIRPSTAAKKSNKC
jgi:hypothetical protein